MVADMSDKNIVIVLFTSHTYTQRSVTVANWTHESKYMNIVLVLS